MKKQNDKAPAHDRDGLHRRRGVWYFALNVRGRRKFFSTRTSNYQEARQVRAAMVKRQLEGTLPSDRAKQKFETALPEVLESRKARLSEGTIEIERARARPLLRYFAGWRVEQIDGPAIAGYQAARLKTAGPRTCNLECRLIRYVLKSAKLWQSVADDFKQLRENTHGPGVALTEAELRVLWDTAASRPEWNTCFLAGMLAAATTARGVELKHLRIEDVDLLARELHIRRSKLDSSCRSIPLSDSGFWAAGQLLSRAAALGATEPSHYVFPRTIRRGVGLDPTRPAKGWRSAWRSLRKAAARHAGRQAADEALKARRGLRAAIKAWRTAAATFAKLRFHDLRHTAVTALAESGASDETVMSISGHLSRAMMEHYSHIRQAAKRAAVESMHGYIPAEQPQEASKRTQ